MPSQSLTRCEHVMFDSAFLCTSRLVSCSPATIAITSLPLAKKYGEVSGEVAGLRGLVHLANTTRDQRIGYVLLRLSCFAET